uniref:Uncharacterized protein n=1 Tax=Oryzias latipes TaxID=8090 RepID=A0A3B3H4J4_ORYLA
SKLLKKVLIYAQQSFGSFSAAAKGAAGGLTAQGCRVEVSDLYAIKFQVSAPAEDINGDEGSLANLVISQFQVLVHCRAKWIVFILSVTTDSLESMFRDIGIMGDMNITLWPMLSCTFVRAKPPSMQDVKFRQSFNPKCNCGNSILKYKKFRVNAPNYNKPTCYNTEKNKRKSLYINENNGALLQTGRSSSSLQRSRVKNPVKWS